MPQKEKHDATVDFRKGCRILPFNGGWQICSQQGLTPYWRADSTRRLLRVQWRKCLTLDSQQRKELHKELRALWLYKGNVKN